MDHSKVYVQIDAQNRITRCEGGYTTPRDLTGWLCIDEGEGDRYNLAQTHYFDGGLHTEDGISRYKMTDGQPVARTAEEIAADAAAVPQNPAPMLEDRIAAAETTLQTHDTEINEIITGLEALANG